MRGEYSAETITVIFSWELPPRARRIHGEPQIADIASGTTSACAENTEMAMAAMRRQGNYLRVRGEYRPRWNHPRVWWELPPRARRIRCYLFHIRAGRGTTSACAENTIAWTQPKAQSRNYLRVRGEYQSPKAAHLLYQELPPRARRIPFCSFLTIYYIGTTSACAENTAIVGMRNPFGWNYLRVRGEYYQSPKAAHLLSELPPRARRIPISARGAVG